MLYGEEHSGSVYVSKWLGAYELELHQVLEELCAGNYTTVINIGCAEGYYAVGLARRLTHATVVAFDLDPAAADACRRLAELNGVADRVEVRAACQLADLDALAGRDTLVVCDCEGAELELLDPDRAPGLRETDLVVELHDFVNPVISQVLRQRFAPSHRITLISSIERNPADFPALKGLSLRDQRMALEEFRPGPMQWAVLRRSGSSKGGARE
jgi:hypothetical protein